MVRFLWKKVITFTLDIAIDINSVLKIDEKLYPQTYLEQCKYKLKKKKIVNYIVDEIIVEDGDSDSDSYVEI